MPRRPAAAPRTAPRSAAEELRRGTLAAASAFTIWGLSPLYFRAVGSVPPFAIVSHRLLWSVVFLAAVIALLPQAFARRSQVSVWLNPRERWLVLDAGSQGKADELISSLVRVAGQGFAILLL